MPFSQDVKYVKNTTNMLKYTMLNAFWGWVCVPLNANELQLPAQGAELQELVSYSHTHALDISNTFSFLRLNQSQTKMEKFSKLQLL